MNELEQKFWDAAITEAATRRRPPDQAAEILQRLAAPAPALRALAAKPAAGPGPRRLSVLRYALELAVAASLLLAIGVATGLIPLTTRHPAEMPLPTPREIAGAPGSDYTRQKDHIELHSGWLLVSTGTPEIRCGGSSLQQVDGRVLVHASGVPTREQAEAVLGWLNANKLGVEMIGEMKRWVQAAGMAALVLSGSALLDGQRIQAQEEPKVEPGQWFTVRTVMDIDKLPADAKLVRGQEVSGAHLEFLAAHDSIEEIDFSNCENLRPGHIQSLKAMKNLRRLELRGARWDGTPNFMPVADLGKLKELAIDYVPQVMYSEGKFPPDNWEKDWNVIDGLSQLSAGGVVITLGNLNSIDAGQLKRITDRLPTLRELNLADNQQINDADMRSIAEHKSLQSLDIQNCGNVTELGLAYLAKQNRLSSLHLDPALTEAILYQLSRMTNLERLDADCYLDTASISDPDKAGALNSAALEKLGTLQKLKHLGWRLADGVTAADFAPLSKLKSLTSLRLTGWVDGAEVLAFEVAAGLPVTTLALHSDAPTLMADSGWNEDEGLKARVDKLAENKNLTELRLNLSSSITPETAKDPGMLPSILRKLPNLKRIRITFGAGGGIVYPKDSSDSGFFVQYVKRYLGSYQVDVIGD